MAINNDDAQNNKVIDLTAPYLYERMEEEVHLRDYWMQILKHRWVVILTFLSVMALTVVYTFTVKPIYKATAKLLIQKDLPSVLTSEGITAYGGFDQAFFNSQLAILKSRPLARQVVANLDLMHNQHFYMPPPPDVKNLLKKSKPVTEADGVPAEVIDGLVNNVEVAPERNSYIVLLSFKSQYPELATHIVNNLSESYIAMQVENRTESSMDKGVFLQDQLEKQKRQVEAAELALQKYMESSGVISPISSDKENIAYEKLSLLHADLQAVKLERTQLQQTYEQVLAAHDDLDRLLSIPGIMDNANISALQKNLIEINQEIAKLSVTLGPKHPTMIKLQDQKESLTNSLYGLVRNYTGSLQMKYKTAMVKERELSNGVVNQKQEMLNLNKKSIQYEVLKRDVDTNRELYEILLKRARETKVESSGGGRAVNIKIIDKAEIPRAPIKPRKMVNLTLGLLLGLFFGIILAFLREYLDTTVSSPDEIKNRFHLPILGPLPKMESGSDAAKEKGELYIHHDHARTIGEAFRGIRTSLLLSSPSTDKGRIILVTSPGPREGKTLVAANIAVVMAQNGLRTLVIDGDLRKPRLHHVFKISRERGLSNCLVNNEDPVELAINTEVENLQVLSSGPLPPNPSDLFTSERTNEVFQYLRTQYDCVIIDAPPIMPVTDPVLLSFYVDTVALIVKVRGTTKHMLRQALDRIRSSNPQVPIGAVMNNYMIARDNYYYYNYYYYYYHYYGDEEGGVTREKRKKRRGGSSRPAGHSGSSSHEDIRQQVKASGSNYKPLKAISFLRRNPLVFIVGLLLGLTALMGVIYAQKCNSDTREISHPLGTMNRPTAKDLLSQEPVATSPLVASASSPIIKEPTSSVDSTTSVPASSSILVESPPPASTLPAMIPPVADKTDAKTLSRNIKPQVNAVWDNQRLTLDFVLGPGVSGRHEVMTLDNPRRIVIDIFVSAKEGKAVKNFELPANPLISLVRYGEREGFVRFVLDVAPQTLPQFEVTDYKGGVRIVLSSPANETKREGA